MGSRDRWLSRSIKCVVAAAVSPSCENAPARIPVKPHPKKERVPDDWDAPEQFRRTLLSMEDAQKQPLAEHSATIVATGVGAVEDV